MREQSIFICSINVTQNNINLASKVFEKKKYVFMVHIYDTWELLYRIENDH